MRRPFLLEQCVHRLHICLCGMGVELKADTPEWIADVRRLFYGSAFNAPDTSVPDVKCYIATHCVEPWIFSIEISDTLHVAKRHPTRLQAYEFYEWNSGRPRVVGESWLTVSEGTAKADADALMRINYLRLRLTKTMLKNRENANLRILHAAALEWKGYGLLAVGGSHSGKSTLAISAALHGIRYLAEENAVVDLQRGLLHPFPTPLHLRSGTLALNGMTDALIRSTVRDMSGDMRYLVDLSEVKPDAVGKLAVPLTHIVIMMERKSCAEIAPLSSHSVIRECIESEVLPGAGDALRLFWDWAALMPGIRSARLYAGPLDKTIDLLKRWILESSEESST